MSRLCFRLPTVAPTPSFFSPTAVVAATLEGDEGALAREEASFSADCTLFRSGERGGSALLGLEICLTRGGEEWSFTGKDWPTLDCPRAWPGSGDGERCGELL